MKNKLIFAVLIIIILVGGYFLLYRQLVSTSPTQSIKIGAILPLTGNLAKAGEDTQVALAIAQEDLKSQYPNVQIVVEDDGFKPDASVSAFNKLVSTDKVVAVIGPLNGSNIEAVRSLANRYNIIAMTPWGGANKIDKFLLKDSWEVDDEARAIAETAIKNLGLKRLGILYFQNDYGVSQKNSFKKLVEELGGEFVIDEPFLLTANDWRAELTKIIDAKLDGLYIIHNGGNVGRITKQARELGLNIQLFGQYGTESSDLIAIGGSSLEGLIYTSTISPDLSNKQIEFVNKFKEKTGNLPQPASYHAYDIYSLLVSALNHCGNQKGSCVSDFITGTQSYEGVSGKFAFESGAVKRQVYLRQIKNGQIIKF